MMTIPFAEFDDIIEYSERCRNTVQKCYPDHSILPVIDCSTLEFLGNAISQNLSKADMVVFFDDYWHHRGSLAVWGLCEMFNINTLQMQSEA
jgi:hypothetical protein